LSGILLVLVIKNWKIIFVSPILLIGLLSSQIRQRLFTIFSASYATDSAIDGRLWAGNNMIELFCNLPFFGVGAGTYGTQNSIYFNSPIYLRGLQNGFYPFNPADSQWLQILAQTGVVGSLFLLLFFVSLFIYNLRSFLQTNSYIFLGLIATIAALVVNGLFENILSFGVIAITAGAIMGIGINYGQKNCNSL
jgi:O-antigen ligase